jgi:hypothetical protein
VTAVSDDVTTCCVPVEGSETVPTREQLEEIERAAEGCDAGGGGEDA